MNTFHVPLKYFIWAQMSLLVTKICYAPIYWGSLVQYVSCYIVPTFANFILLSQPSFSSVYDRYHQEKIICMCFATKVEWYMWTIMTLDPNKLSPLLSQANLWVTVRKGSKVSQWVICQKLILLHLWQRDWMNRILQTNLPPIMLILLSPHPIYIY